MDQNQTMVEGNWKCAECGKDITQLPFKPDEGRPVYCRDCHAKIRDRDGGGRRDFGGRRDSGPRQMIQGDWKCSKCGVAITELPFRPIAGRDIYCRECWGKMRETKY